MSLNKYLKLMFLIFSCYANAKNIKYIDDIYMQQASAYLVKQVDRVIQQIGYTGDYELVEPNKAGLLINPWNRLISSGVNPITQNNFISISTDWFDNLSKDEQDFLIARCFTKFENRKDLVMLKVIPFIFSLSFWMLIFCFFWLINKTRFSSKKKWLKIFVAYLIAFILNITVFVKLQQKCLDYVLIQNEKDICSLTLAKLQNKEAAVNALEAMDAAINDGIKNGEVGYKSYEHYFEKFAEYLKNK